MGGMLQPTKNRTHEMSAAGVRIQLHRKKCVFTLQAVSENSVVE